MRRYLPHIIVLVGLAARLYLAPHWGHRGDEEAFQRWLQDALNYGLADFYANSECNYPPIWVYMLWLIGHAARAVGFPLVAADPLYRVVLKLPQILADVGIFYLIWWQFLRSMPWRPQALWSAAIALNPALIFMSGVWCQVEPMMGLAMVGAVVAYARERPALSLTCLMLSVLVKPLALVSVPILLLAIFRRHGATGALSSLLAAGVATAAAMLPLNIHQPPTLLLRLCLKTAGWFGYSSINAFNVWALTGFWEADERLLWGLSHAMWGSVCFAVAYLGIVALVWRRHDLRGLLAALTLTQLAFFLFPTMIHERYIYLPAVLAMLWAIQDAWVAPVAFVLTVTATLNFHYRVRVPGVEVLARLHADGTTVYAGALANLACFGSLLATVWRRSSPRAE